MPSRSSSLRWDKLANALLLATRASVAAGVAEVASEGVPALEKIWPLSGTCALRTASSTWLDTSSAARLQPPCRGSLQSHHSTCTCPVPCRSRYHRHLTGSLGHCSRSHAVIILSRLNRCFYGDQKHACRRQTHLTISLARMRIAGQK